MSKRLFEMPTPCIVCRSFKQYKQDPTQWECMVNSNNLIFAKMNEMSGTLRLQPKEFLLNQPEDCPSVDIIQYPIILLSALDIKRTVDEIISDAEDEGLSADEIISRIKPELGAIVAKRLQRWAETQCENWSETLKSIIKEELDLSVDDFENINIGI